VRARTANFQETVLRRIYSSRRAFVLVIKRIVKQNRKRARHWWHCKFHAFSPSDLTNALLSLGLGTGDVVFVHIAFNEFIGFTGRPSDVLASLRSAVSESGTLLMPSTGFDGTTVDYARSGQVFDVRRTASQMGLVTELFRRSAGTIRSLHPTHSVLASGPKADELLRDHPLATTPCGLYSPYAKLDEARGKIALLGTGIAAMTYYHCLEELLESLLPQSPFTKEKFNIAYRGYNGETRHISTRLFDPRLAARRRLDALEDELKLRGSWRERRVGRVSVIILETCAVREAARAMAERGTYCYV
jgi:aminoglycoside 3-N-acetyltransferase